MEKVLVGMSGGVDSSVAVALLKEQGYDVCGLTMGLYRNDPASASRVAEHMGIEHRFVDFEDRFLSEVIEPFASEYVRGGTPNPCIVCNKKLKFGSMLDYARKNGFDYIATGHYARIVPYKNKLLLKKAKDETKDQTYFLYNLTQYILRQTLFPLGGYTKAEIRDMAHELGFENAGKKDSQDICFVDDGDYAGFLVKECGIESPPGDFLDTEHRIIGKHRGLIHYTVGQRKGLGQTFGKAVYVIEKDAKNNAVILGSGDELLEKKVHLEKVNMISGEKSECGICVEAKIRYNQAASPAVFRPDETLEFKEAQRAVAPGQSAVFYQGDRLLGGGVISLK